MDEINNIYSIKELLEYKENILRNIKEDKDFQVFNDSAMHASIIMTALLSTCKELEIYCGRFSIFREQFSEKIRRMLDAKFYDSIREKQIFKGFRPYQESIDALKDFLEDESKKLTVIVDENIDDLANDKSLGSIISSPNIKFYQRNDSNDGLAHFTVGSKDGKVFSMYRNELSKTQRTAICNFGNPQIANSFHECFASLKLDAIEKNF